MIPDPTCVLAISNDANLLSNANRFLTAFGYGVVCCNGVERLPEAIRVRRPDVLLADARSGSGLDFNHLHELGADPCLNRPHVIAIVDHSTGADLARLVEAGADEILEAGSWGELLCQLRAAARLREFERRLTQLCGLDPLTLLASPEQFQAELTRAWDERRPLACVHVTLDFAAAPPTGLGTGAWQLILRSAARVLERLEPRPLAIAGAGRGAYRLLLDASQTPDPVDTAERLRAAFEATRVSLGDGALTLTVSCGVASHADVQQADDLLMRAAAAAEAGLQRGGNLVVTDEERQLLDEQWRRLAEPEALYSSTTARHLMLPFTRSLRADESLRRAGALFEQTGIECLPVVDGNGACRGLLMAEDVTGDLSRHASEACHDDTPTIDEHSPFAQVLDLLGDPRSPRVMVLRAGIPVGLIRATDIALLDQLPAPPALPLDAPLTSAQLIVS